MKIRTLILLVSCLAGAVFFTACKKKKNNNSTDTGLDRKPMLVNYADNYIVPAYAAMLQDIGTLKTKTEAFTASPDITNLDAVRIAYTNAYTRWQQADMLEFGPAEDISLRMYMNTYPVTVTKLNNNITSGSYNLEEFGNKDAQGFPAVDYLLFGLAPQPADLLAYYTTDAQATARKQYLIAVVNKMYDKINTVNTAWGSYKATFTERTGTDAGSSLSEMVNGFVLYYERYLRSGKIGLPVGAMTGVAKPELTESYYNPDLSKTLALTGLASVMAFFEGKSFDGTQTNASMKSYLASIGAKDDNGVLISNLITTELEQANAALKDINTPLRTAVQADRPKVLALYDELQQVVPLLKVDMVSAFGISITYTDNDGD